MNERAPWIVTTVLTVAASSPALTQTPDKKMGQEKPVGEKVAASSNVEQAVKQLDTERVQRGDGQSLPFSREYRQRFGQP